MTIVEIAEKAGVSKSTVSRVLVQPEKVAPETLELIRKIMKENNFKPRRHIARKKKPTFLDSEKTGNVAMLFPDENLGAMSTPLSSALAHSIEKQLFNKEMNLFLTHFRDEKRLPPCIENKQVDGVIVRAGDSESMNRIVKEVTNIPMVCIFESGVMADRFDMVCPDNIRVGELAFEYLEERGHKSVIILSPIGGDVHLPSKYRTVGFKKASSDKAELFHMESRGGVMSTARMIERYLAMDKRPTGIYCLGSDFEVEIVGQALQERGVKLCEDVDIICAVNDPYRIKSLDARMPYVDIRPDEIGAKAVEILFKRIESPELVPQKVLVEPELVLPEPEEII